MSGKAQQLLEQARTMLDEYYKTLEEGESPSLTEFDSVVRSLCEEVTLLPKNEAEKYKEPMSEIEQSLGNLAKLLEEKKEIIKEQIEGLDYNKKAQTAYRAAENLSEDKKE